MLPQLPDEDLETLTVHLARHAREVELLLKGKPLERESETDITPTVSLKAVTG